MGYDETGSPMDADELIARYGLEPHTEGGRYRKTFRAPAGDGGGAPTAIYDLPKPDEISAWHWSGAVEIRHCHAGNALRLDLSPDWTPGG